MAKYKVSLHGKMYEVEVEKGEAILLDEYEITAPKAPVSAAVPVAQAVTPAPTTASVNASENAVKSPLPGVVVAIKANVGQTVKAGDTVVIIEAMKMENEIVAPNGGTIKAIHVQKGASVQTDAPLFEIQ